MEANVVDTSEWPSVRPFFSGAWSRNRRFRHVPLNDDMRIASHLIHHPKYQA